MGHSPGVGLSLLDLNHVNGLKGVVMPAGGAVQYQVNNYLQAIRIEVSNCYISLHGTFMVKIILEYQTFGIVRFPNAFCTKGILYIYQYKGIFRKNVARTAEQTSGFMAGAGWVCCSCLWST